MYFTVHVAACAAKVAKALSKNGDTTTTGICECGKHYSWSKAKLDEHRLKCSNYRAVHPVVPKGQPNLANWLMAKPSPGGRIGGGSGGSGTFTAAAAAAIAAADALSPPRGGAGATTSATTLSSTAAAVAAAALALAPSPAMSLFSSPGASPSPSLPPSPRARAEQMICRGFTRLCPGYSWKQPFCENYPFQLHKPEKAGMVGHIKLTWEATSGGRFISDRCMGFYSSALGCCERCDAIQHKSVFVNMKARVLLEGMEGIRGLQYSDLTHPQLCTVSRHHKLTKDSSATDARNAAVKVCRLTATLTLQKQIIVYISENRIPRIHQLLGVQLRAGSSGVVILDKLVSAVSGVYHAKGFTREDVDASTMAWRIGGPRCLAMLCAREGYACLRGCGRSAHLFLLSSKGFNMEDMLANILAVLGVGVDTRPKVLMMDEVAAKPTPRYDKRYSYNI
jgi:hypothetical protein